MGDLSAEVCQFQDANDDPTPILGGREWESVGVILRWPRSGSRVAELKFVMDRCIRCVFLVMGDWVCGPRS